MTEGEVAVDEDGVSGRTPARVEALVRKVAPIARVAGSTRNAIKVVSIVFAVAAAATWYVLFVPFSTAGPTVVVVSLLVAIALLIPAAIWGLLFLAVGQVMSLPTRLSEIASGGKGHLQDAISSTIRPEEKGIAKRIVGLLRSLVDASGTFGEAKLLLVESTALLRVFNPITLIAVVVGFILGVGLVIFAAIGLLATGIV